MEEFYLQFNRKNGNSNLFWCKKGGNTTTNLSEAETYDRNTAFERHDRHNAMVPWPKVYVDEKIRSTVPKSILSLNLAYEGMDVNFKSLTPAFVKVLRCKGCGRMVNEHKFYESPCLHCSFDNTGSKEEQMRMDL